MPDLFLEIYKMSTTNSIRNNDVSLEKGMDEICEMSFRCGFLNGIKIGLIICLSIIILIQIIMDYV